MSNNRIINIATIAYLAFLLIILAIFGYTPTNDTDGYLEYAQVCLHQGEAYPCSTLIKGTPFIWNIGSINLIVFSLWLFGSFYPILVLMCICNKCGNKIGVAGNPHLTLRAKSKNLVL